MKSTKEQRKEKAIEMMKELGIYAPYINGYKKRDDICFFEQFGGYWLYQEADINKLVQDFELKHHCTVYAVTHEYCEFGECWDYLFIPEESEEWDYLLDNAGNHRHYAAAYVYNKDCPEYSEFGDIVVQSFGGGIRRVA